MPFEEMDLETFREAIIAWRTEDNMTISEIKRQLSYSSLAISEPTLKRRLLQWNIPNKQQRFTDSEALRMRITEIHHRQRLTDQEAARILKRDGFTIGAWRI